MINRGVVLGVTLGLGLLIAWQGRVALAAGDANAAKGLIANHCIKCHETPYSKPGERTEAVDAPTFQTIADDSEKYSPAKLHEFLRHPHFPMQQFVLSKRDIENILAYLATLRHD